MNKERTYRFLLISLFVLSLFGAKADSVANSFALPLAGPIPGLEDTSYFELEDCQDRIDICAAIPTSQLLNYQITDNGNFYASGIQGCDFDTFHMYQYFLLPGSGSIGPYVLQSWQVGVPSFSGTFNTMSDLVDSMNVWDPAANWVLDPIGFLITGGDPNTVYSDLQIWHSSNPVATILQRLDQPVAQGTQLNFGYGSHQLIFKNTNTGLSDTTQLYISCTETSNIAVNVFLNESDTVCLDFSELLFPMVSVSNICPGAGNGIFNFTSINADSCVVITGTGVGTATACMVACDEGGVCDTTYLDITTSINYQTGSRIIYDTLTEGDKVRYCPDLSVFGGSELETINNFCVNSSGTLLQSFIDATAYCVDASAISSIGEEEICIQICDTASVCDTTYYRVFVKAPGIISVQDTILLNQQVTFCDLNMANLQTAPFSIINACPNVGNENVTFTIDTFGFCLTYEGEAAGTSNACIYIQDSLGNVDTTLFEILVILPSPETQEINMTVGDSMTICVDGLELIGRLETVTNICPGVGHVDFFMDETALCLELDALSAGYDSACYIFCDEFNLCDTIFWKVEVAEQEFEKPTGTDDYSSLLLGTSLDIDLCGNDVLPTGDWTRLELLDQSQGGSAAKYGIASLDKDNCTLNYISTGTTCEVTEELTYLICNGSACDTGKVFIEVLCEEVPLQFFDGFSPNGDQVNDVFKIGGIEEFPNNRLLIYNRWGLQLLEVRNYQNDWNGTWNNQDLPDGIYFYQFDNGEGQQYTGTLVLNR